MSVLRTDNSCQPYNLMIAMKRFFFSLWNRHFCQLNINLAFLYISIERNTCSTKEWTIKKQPAVFVVVFSPFVILSWQLCSWSIALQTTARTSVLVTYKSVCYSIRCYIFTRAFIQIPSSFEDLYWQEFLISLEHCKINDQKWNYFWFI